MSCSLHTACGSACERSPFVPAKPSGARYLTHASDGSDEKQASLDD